MVSCFIKLFLKSLTRIFNPTILQKPLFWRFAKTYRLTDFSLWFETGLWHIADWQGYDHILFLLALCCMYQWRDWKALLVLVTAFTLGHSLTLALSVMKVVNIKAAYIEFAIPLSIVLTSVYNLSNLNRKVGKGDKTRYAMALFFGLVHGLGFSYLLKSMLGRQTDLLLPLFAFNVGLEAGQILILLGVLLLGSLATLLKVKERDWRFFLSAAVFGISLIMTFERYPL